MILIYGGSAPHQQKVWVLEHPLRHLCDWTDRIVVPTVTVHSGSPAASTQVHVEVAQ